MKNEFVKIRAFEYAPEAHIVKGRLEHEGIEVFMADNFTIDTDPLVSNAIGGVKLYVKAEDAENANKVLESISRYSVDENGIPISCPNCGDKRMEVGSTVRNTKSLLAFLFSFGLLGTLPFYTKYKYRCNNCKNEFNIK
ncbi:DUF2007 domain-containing protein [Flavobacterium coralii]|uniref:putative signal transducing protein n=1 Tax=Flavobacterium coralii TaxID=2838017 RepID=UPI000C4FA380|nr:hypothetical protein [Flavobacterium sp.]|tara:strand:+ start:31426 stop:31842 length:417 start_codon:yes stop_codon:yes gene_type:complete